MKLVVLLSFLFCVSESFGRVQNYFSILNPDTNLVLDGKNELVETKAFTHSDTELWKLSSASNNTFYIVNKHNGNVLEAGDGNGARVRAVPNTGSAKQQWYINSSGSTFVSAIGNKAMDAKDGKGGNVAVIFPRNGLPCQKFRMSYE